MGETRQTWRRGRGKGKVCGCLGIRREKEKKVAAKRLNRHGKRDHKRERSLVRISTPIKRNSKGMKGWFCQYDCSVSVTLSALSRNIYSNDFPVMGPLNSSHTHTHTHTSNEHSRAYTQYWDYCELFKEERSDRISFDKDLCFEDYYLDFYKYALLCSLLLFFFTYQVDRIV